MRPVKESLREYSRGIIGGLIFSLPLLYTMEVWWAGFQLGSGRLLLMLALAMVLLLGYNTYAGVRSDETRAGVVIDSVEELGLGLVVSATILALLGRIGPGDSVREVMGKIVIEALLIAIGISVGTSQFAKSDDLGSAADSSVDHGSSKDRESEGGNDGDGGSEGFGITPKDIKGVVALSACGAVVLGTNIAITDEIVMIGYESNSWQLLGMVVATLLLCTVVQMFSDLLGQHVTEPRSKVARYACGTAVAYSVGFCCSAIILFLFGRFDGVAFQPCLAMTVVLTVASSLGAAAGKILIQ